MAGIDVITKSRIELDETIYDLVNLVKVCDSLNPDNPPDWLAMIFGRVLDLDRKIETYVSAVQEHAIPLLRDVAQITSGKALKPLQVAN
jgi:hypothetical protein